MKPSSTHSPLPTIHGHLMTLCRSKTSHEQQDVDSVNNSHSNNSLPNSNHSNSKSNSKSHTSSDVKTHKSRRNARAGHVQRAEHACEITSKPLIDLQTFERKVHSLLIRSASDDLNELSLNYGMPVAFVDGGTTFQMQVYNTLAMPLRLNFFFQRCNVPLAMFELIAIPDDLHLQTFYVPQDTTLICVQLTYGWFEAFVILDAADRQSAGRLVADFGEIVVVVKEAGAAFTASVVYPGIENCPIVVQGTVHSGRVALQGKSGFEEDWSGSLSAVYVRDHTK